MIWRFRRRLLRSQIMMYLVIYLFLCETIQCFIVKTFFPAIDKYKKNTKDTAPIENMINKGLGEYCQKFNIMNPRDELLGDGDMKSLVQQIITDEMEDLEEGVMDFAKKVGSMLCMEEKIHLMIIWHLQKDAYKFLIQDCWQ